MGELTWATATKNSRHFMDGKIFNSDGRYVADLQANGIYDRAGKRLYVLKGEKIYRPSGELVGHLSINEARRLGKSADRLFPTVSEAVHLDHHPAGSDHG